MSLNCFLIVSPKHTIDKDMHEFVWFLLDIFLMKAFANLTIHFWNVAFVWYGKKGRNGISWYAHKTRWSIGILPKEYFTEN